MRRTDPNKLDVSRRKIGGKWKPVIIFILHMNPERFNKIKQLAPGITSSVLNTNLKQMVENGLVNKIDGPVVKYALTQDAERIAQHMFEIRKIVDLLP